MEIAEDVERSCSRIAQIPCGSCPTIAVGLDEAVASETAKDRGSVPAADSKETCCTVDGQSRVLAEGGVETACEVSEPVTREQIVSLVGEFVLKDADELSATSEELSGGGGTASAR